MNNRLTKVDEGTQDPALLWCLWDSLWVARFECKFPDIDTQPLVFSVATKQRRPAFKSTVEIAQVFLGHSAMIGDVGTLTSMTLQTKVGEAKQVKSIFDKAGEVKGVVCVFRKNGQNKEEKDGAQIDLGKCHRATPHCPKLDECKSTTTRSFSCRSPPSRLLLPLF